MPSKEELDLVKKLAEKKEVFSEYDVGLCVELLNFIKNDNELKEFHERFQLECENISDVIEKAKEEGKSPVLLEILKVHNDGFRFSKGNASALADTDSKFHNTLYDMNFNFKLIQKARDNILAGGEPIRIWQSIIQNDNHYRKLIDAHSNIVTSIENYNDASSEKIAITAMQQHFAIIIIHYIQQLNPKSSPRVSGNKVNTRPK